MLEDAGLHHTWLKKEETANMSNMKADEMYILKAVSIKLADGIVFINTLQYHTEKGDRSKSRYRWLGRVCRVDDVNAKIAELRTDAQRLEPWKWPNDPSWDGKIYYSDSDNLHQANWLRLKLMKTVDWDTGLKILNGWDKKSGDYNLSKKYDTESYTTEAGELVDITDKDALAKLVGQNVWKEQVKKVKVLDAKVPAA